MVVATTRGGAAVQGTRSGPGRLVVGGRMKSRRVTFVSVDIADDVLAARVAFVTSSQRCVSKGTHLGGFAELGIRLQIVD